MTSFKVGDKVKFISADVSGEIVSYEGNGQYTIESLMGYTYVRFASELKKFEPPRPHGKDWIGKKLKLKRTGSKYLCIGQVLVPNYGEQLVVAGQTGTGGKPDDFKILYAISPEEFDING